MSYVKLSVSVKSFAPALFERMKAAEATLAEVRKEIVEAYLATDDGKGVSAIAKPHKYGGEKLTFIWDANGSMAVSLEVTDDGTFANGTRQPLYLGEKTINMLLSGKLLDEAEKRKLLDHVTAGAIPANQAPA